MAMGCPLKLVRMLSSAKESSAGSREVMLMVLVPALRMSFVPRENRMLAKVMAGPPAEIV